MSLKPHLKTQKKNWTSTMAEQRKFLGDLHSGTSTAMRYEDAPLQAQALSLLPLTQLHTHAATLGGDPRDALLRALMRWFKRDFFAWVDNPPCEACGSTSTHGAGTVAPTVEERGFQAGVVETYRCVLQC
jgi:peptide-N4-(N-acetyl-beta-glucosaminyl)asparagine amidase